jgi:hypothetical protein
MTDTRTGVNAAAARVPAAQTFEVTYAAAADDAAVIHSVLKSMPLLAVVEVVEGTVRVAGYRLMARIRRGSQNAAVLGVRRRPHIATDPAARRARGLIARTQQPRTRLADHAKA